MVFITLPDLDIRIKHRHGLRLREKLRPIHQQGAELIDRIIRVFFVEVDKEIVCGDSRSSYGTFSFRGA